MKVKEIITQLKKLPLNDNIIITSMDDYFICNDFEISPKENEAHEIILNVFIDSYTQGRK